MKYLKVSHLTLREGSIMMSVEGINGILAETIDVTGKNYMETLSVIFGCRERLAKEMGMNISDLPMKFSNKVRQMLAKKHI